MGQIQLWAKVELRLTFTSHFPTIRAINNPRCLLNQIHIDLRKDYAKCLHHDPSDRNTIKDLKVNCRPLLLLAAILTRDYHRPEG
jgi:hypothetical protein